MSRTLLVYAGNPTQYHSPLFREMARSLGRDIEVLFGDEIGSKPFYSDELQSVIEWDVPVLEGYPSRFFANRADESRKGFWSRNNPGMFGYVLNHAASHVLIHGYDTLSSWYVYFAALLSGKKIIWRGEAIEQKARGWRPADLVKRIVLPLYFRGCDRVLYSCIGNRRYLAKYLGRRSKEMVAFPCAVDNAFFEALRLTDPDALASVRAELSIPAGDLVIASCCRLTRRKRIDLLIRAAAAMRSRAVSILLIGDGPERAALTAQATEAGVRLVVAGFVGQRTVARLLSVADVFTLISHYDASPKALNEAMTFPIPMVASDGVGTAEDLVREGVNGYIFRGDTAEPLTAILDELAANPSLRATLGQRNAEVLKEYSIERDVTNLRAALDGGGGV